MNAKMNAWISAGAFAGIFIVAGCEIVAFSTGPSGSTGSGSGSATGTTTSASGSTSASSGSGCAAPARTGACNAASKECFDACVTYTCDCSTPNDAYGSLNNCCGICATWGGGVTGNTLSCRLLKGFSDPSAICSEAGPYSVQCGGITPDTAALFKAFCGTALPPPGSPNAFLLKAVTAQLSGNNACLMCDCQEASTGMPVQCPVPGC